MLRACLSCAPCQEGGCCGVQNCFGSARDYATYVALQAVEDQAEKAVDSAAAKMGALIDKGQERIQKIMKELDGAAKPQAMALMQMFKSSNFKKLQTSPQAQQALEAGLGALAQTTAGEDFGRAFDDLESGLKTIEADGLSGASQMLIKLSDSRLKSMTGHWACMFLPRGCFVSIQGKLNVQPRIHIRRVGTVMYLAALQGGSLRLIASFGPAGEMFGFIKASPTQMASDRQELDDILAFVEKLQDTVNKNNWDATWLKR